MRLLPGGAEQFRSIFFQIVTDLGIQDLGITPALLRAGGANHSFSTGACDLGQLKLKGRWAALSTLEHYVQECTATLVMLRLSEQVLDRLEQLFRFGTTFAFPPAAPWHSYFCCRAKQKLVDGSSGSLPRRPRRVPHN